MKLLNAFSLNMVTFPVAISVTEISVSEARALLASGFESAVGHADTAAVFSGLLGLTVQTNRVTICLGGGDQAVVGQYTGPRLPEGATVLPEGAAIKWLLLAIS